MSQVVTWNLGMLHLGPSVIAMGVFDGVHAGHQALLADTSASARSHGVAGVALTFEPDPEAILRPEAPPPRILERDDRLELMASTGLDIVVELPFDHDLSDLHAVDFLDKVVLHVTSPVAIVVGEDFRFGTGAEGTVSTIRSHGEAHGYMVLPQELVVINGMPVTSTRIRTLVTEGSVAEAARLLGRPHRLRGLVVRGRGIGTDLGVPTANLEIHQGALLPADGVYAAVAYGVGDHPIPAAVCVGAPPTYDGAPAMVEAHLVDVNADFYGTTIRLDLIQRLRDTAEFGSETDLAAAITMDITRVRELLGP